MKKNGALLARQVAIDLAYSHHMQEAARMHLVTSCYLRQATVNGEVLLGMKKKGFGTGYYVGIGGHVEPGETVELAAVRELEEEVGVLVAPEDLHSMGNVIFLFPARPQWNLDVALFAVERWQGQIVESEEMIPAWFLPAEIPYDRMWQDARYWLPHLLDGIRLQARIIYKEDNQTVDEVWLKLLPPEVYQKA